MKKLILLILFATSSLLARHATELRIYPEVITLDHKSDYQNIVAQVFYDDLSTQDISSNFNITFQNPQICDLREDILYPKENGGTLATISYGELKKEIQIQVNNVETKSKVSFNLDVIPTLTGLGCNSGGCHGASRGQDKFHLSLFGYDPEGDYKRIRYEFAGRRLNSVIPAHSLFLQKATKEVPHVGGQLFEKNSDAYNTILQWIKKGAKKDPKEIKKPTKLEFYPLSTNITPQEKQKVSVRVSYSDGSTQDVTHLCAFFTSDSSSAKVIDNKHILSKAPGEAHILARYGTLTALSTVTSIPHQAPNIVAISENNYIDEINNKKWQSLRIQAADNCSDEVFLRRIYLDLTGQLPTEKEFYDFINDKSDDKRNKIIDRLAESDDFKNIWAMKFAELLQLRTDNNYYPKNVRVYYDWLQEQFQQGRSFDQIVKDLISAQGDTFKHPPANFYQIQRDNKVLGENVAQVFMGIRLQCSQCHNNPFDRWTLDDYYSYAAFFANIKRKKGYDPRSQIIFENKGGSIKHPVYNKPMPLKFLGGDNIDEPNKRRTEALAEWLCNDQNPYFSKTMANRMWEHFFGRGIIHPVDDARLSNPPANADLLDSLGKKFIEYNYDIVKLAKDICKSQTYQLSSKQDNANPNSDKFFSKATIRRMRAEVLMDCINQVSDTKSYYRQSLAGTRAINIASARTDSPLLKTFGRSDRRSPSISCEVLAQPNLAQSLALLNSTIINEKINKSPLLKKIYDAKLDRKKFIRKLYVRTLSRKPTEQELQTLLSYYKDQNDPRPIDEDIFWSLLNSKEFLFVR